MTVRSGPLRAGLIGLGNMGRNHARILGNLAGVQLVGIVEPAPPNKGPIGVPVVPTVADLVAMGVDYAVVASPTGTHLDIGLELAAHGVSALLEKPLAHTVEAAQKLVAAFES